MSINFDLLRTLLVNQKYAIKYHIVFAAIVGSLGIGLLIFSFFYIGGAFSKDPISIVLKIGGLFITVVSGYPINQIVSRKEKINVYQTLLNNKNNMTEIESQKMDDLVLKWLEKIS